MKYLIFATFSQLIYSAEMKTNFPHHFPNILNAHEEMLQYLSMSIIALVNNDRRFRPEDRQTRHTRFISGSDFNKTRRICTSRSPGLTHFVRRREMKMKRAREVLLDICKSGADTRQ
jgi:hypothetical protein